MMAAAVPVHVLHAAVRKGDLDAVKDLVDSHGADVDAVYYGATALMVASQYGHTELALWLLDRGCDVETSGGLSVLEEAVAKNQVDVVRCLLERGMNPDMVLSSGETPLTYAARKRLSSLAQVLVRGGADVNAKNSHGETGLYLSAQEGHTGVMEVILKEGGSKDDPCGPDDMTPLMAAVANGHLSAVRFLIKSGCSLNAQDRHGWTALWHAVNDLNEDIARTLLNCGADVTLRNSEGLTALDEARLNDNEDIIELLSHVTS